MNWYIDLWKKQPVVALIGTGAAALGGLWVGRKLFRPPALPRIKLPTGGAGIPVIRLDPQGKPVAWSPAPMAATLYDVMEGIDATETKEAAWLELTNLPTDDMVTAVYNYFNSMGKVRSADAGTLTQWIRDEYGALWNSTKPGVLNRLAAIGLV